MKVPRSTWITAAAFWGPRLHTEDCIFTNDSPWADYSIQRIVAVWHLRPCRADGNLLQLGGRRLAGGGVAD